MQKILKLRRKIL